MRTLPAILILLLAWTAPAPGHAAHGQGRGVLAAQNGGAEQAARSAKRRYGGKVLSVQRVDAENGTTYYEVKLLSNGTVRVVRMPANGD